MTNKKLAIIVGKDQINANDIVVMRDIVGPLFGKFVFKVESTKLDEEETGPNAARLFSVKEVLVTNAEFISGKDTRNGVPTVVFNGDPTLTFAVVENPFKEIDKSAAIRKDIEVSEGWYTDGQGLSEIVKAMNEGTIASYNAKINKFTTLIETVETAIAVDEAAQAQRQALEEAINS